MTTWLIEDCSRRNEFSNVLYRLDDIDQTLGMLTRLTKDLSDRPWPSSSHPHLTVSDRHISEHTEPQEHPDRPSVSLPGQQYPGPAKDESQSPVLLLPSTQHVANLGRPPLDTPLNRNSPHEGNVYTDTVELQYGGERTYKYPGALAMLKVFTRKLVNGCLEAHNTGMGEEGDQNSRTRTVILQQLESFPFQGQCPQPAVVRDLRPVVAPPQSITRLFMDGYLQNINARTPIFDDRGLWTAVEAYYSERQLGGQPFSQTADNDTTTTDTTWALIFSNIALLELGLETQGMGEQGGSGDSGSPRTNALTDDLIASFLRNANRALGDLAAYTRPSLLNVQALLTLALVAQEFFGSILYEKALRAACQVGRMLGLHLSAAKDNVKDVQAEGATKTRQRLFRVLYDLDKQRAFLTGDACDLYHFDSDVELWAEPSCNATETPPGTRLVSAFNDMMVIWEEVYLKLYSARALSAGAAYLSKQVASLLVLLAEWNEHHPGVMEAVSTSPSVAEENHLTPLQTELKYCYHTTHVLILRCERTTDVLAHARMHDHARACLRLIIDPGQIRGGIPPDTATCAIKSSAWLATLGRMLGTYPMTAFMDLVAFRLEEYLPQRRPQTASPGNVSHDADADMALMRGVLSRLQSLQRTDRPSTYLNLLQIGLTWALQVLEAARRAHRQPLGKQPPTQLPPDLYLAFLGDPSFVMDAASTPTDSTYLSTHMPVPPSVPVATPGFGTPGFGTAMSPSLNPGVCEATNDGWPAVFLGAMGNGSTASLVEGSQGEPPARTSTVGQCRFHGLDPWQVLF